MDVKPLRDSVLSKVADGKITEREFDQLQKEVQKFAGKGTREATAAAAMLPKGMFNALMEKNYASWVKERGDNKVVSVESRDNVAMTEKRMKFFGYDVTVDGKLSDRERAIIQGKQQEQGSAETGMVLTDKTLALPTYFVHHNLALLGIYKDHATTIPTDKSGPAVRDFQQKHGIKPANGVVDKKTQDKLREEGEKVETAAYEKLEKLGYKVGDSVKELERFQAKHHLKETGTLNYETIQALDREKVK